MGLNLIGDRWAFMIIRDVFLGFRQFEELRRRNDMARGTLASRLKSLVGNGILYRHAYQDAPRRYEYRLTEQGLDMYPIVLLSWDWETKWGRGDDVPAVLRHNRCGKAMRPHYRCCTCQLLLRPQDVGFTPGHPTKPAIRQQPRHQRRSRPRGESSPSSKDYAFTLLDIAGDRWTSLVLAAAFFGLQRFDAIASAIGIATNILADRLKLLVSAGVLDKVPYQQKPVRYEYHLSQKGRDLYPRTIATHQWADRWLVEEGKAPLLLKHALCDEPLCCEMVCDQCGGEIVSGDVDFDRKALRREAG